MEDSLFLSVRGGEISYYEIENNINLSLVSLGVLNPLNIHQNKQVREENPLNIQHLTFFLSVYGENIRIFTNFKILKNEVDYFIEIKEEIPKTFI